MGKSHLVIIFSAHNARIEKGISKEEAIFLKNFSNVVVDPDLSAVKGLTPHHWKLEKGKIVPMTESEKQARDALWESFPHLENITKNHLLGGVYRTPQILKRLPRAYSRKIFMFSVFMSFLMGTTFSFLLEWLLRN